MIGLPLLFSAEEIKTKFDLADDGFADKVEKIKVRDDAHVNKELYKIKETKKRPRSSLSPCIASQSPSAKRLIAVQKELRNERDLARKLALLSQYRDSAEYSRVEELKCKWKGVVNEAIEALYVEARVLDSSLSREQFMAALQLGKRIESLISETDYADDDSVLECLCESVD
jgi:hydrogenase maturation factor HypF (carbamoyltransferase family)